MTLPFVIGSAQFGQHYGITNVVGCPSIEEVASILNYGLGEDIHMLDTAFAYGDSLNLIGDFIIQNPSASFNLLNKFSVLSDDDEVYENITSFLNKTGMQNFYGLMIHDPDKLDHVNAEKLLKFLEQLKSENLIKKFGVSIYAPEDLKKVLNILPIEIIQCPINLFDQRFLQTDVLEIIQSRGIEIHARSLFLQGVLLGHSLPKPLQSLKAKWEIYQQILKKNNMSPLQLIMSWVKSLNFNYKWVVGVNTKQELAEIIYAYQNAPQLNEVDLSVLNDASNPFIDPRNWSKK